jgi:hypothetical protein
VLIAPANFAGQGQAWARALERSGLASAANWAFQADPVFAYPSDHAAPISLNAAPKAFQAAQFEQVVEQFQGVVAESGRPIFGRLFDYSPPREARAREAAGLAVAIMWHGSDVRLPSRHRQTHRLSPYALPAMRVRAAELESTARRNRRALLGLGLPQLVSTPDLLDQVPGALWCPVVVSPQANGPGASVLTGRLPRVVHVPSNPSRKGSDLIDGPLRRLAQAGVIDYVRAEGLPAAEVRRLYATADIVADQFRLGIYGVAAVEAMAAGRLVVSDVDPEVYQAVKDATGWDLPIERVAAPELEGALAAIVADPEPHRAKAAAGQAFAAAVHSGERSARVIAAALGLADAPPGSDGSGPGLG